VNIADLPTVAWLGIRKIEVVSTDTGLTTLQLSIS
jgi:hypothetical protein